MLKNLRDVIPLTEVAKEPRTGDEKRFKDKHIIKKTEDREGNKDDVFKGKVKKDKTRPADYKEDEDGEVYEENIPDFLSKDEYDSIQEILQQNTIGLVGSPNVDVKDETVSQIDTVLAQLRNLAAGNIEVIEFETGIVPLSVEEATILLSVRDELSEDNQENFDTYLETSEETFNHLVSISIGE